MNSKASDLIGDARTQLGNIQKSRQKVHPDEVAHAHASVSLALAQSNVELAEALSKLLTATERNGAIKQIADALNSRMDAFTKKI
ncbi:hypothetical protein [Streptomyces sp. NPDC001661]